MRPSVFRVKCGEAILCRECLYSGSYLFRMKGLLGRSGLGESEGIWLKPCNSIHMFFMKFPIDAVFLDKENRVLHIENRIAPWKISRLVFKAASVLEIQAGAALRQGLKPGDSLVFQENLGSD